MSNPKENYGQLNLNIYQSSYETEWILVPGNKGRRESYKSIDDNKDVKMHPFLISNITTIQNIKYLLLPLTSKKPLIQYHKWICDCGKEHQEIYTQNKKKLLLYDIAKSTKTKKPSLVKLMHEYTITEILLSYLIGEEILILKEKIEPLFIENINSFKIKEKKCLSNFKKTGSFLLNSI